MARKSTGGAPAYHRWNLYSIDRMQRFKLNCPIESFFSQWTELIFHLAAPVVPSSYFEKNKWPKPRSDTSNAAVPLLKLPLELLQMISDEMIDNYLDIICLALTCTAMWEITERTRYLFLLATLQSQNWAGTRIICLGQYARDLPKGLLNLEDKKRFEEVVEEQGETLNYEDESDSEELALFKQVSRTFSRPEQTVSLLSIDNTHGQDVLDEIYDEIETSLRGRKAARRWVKIGDHDFRLVSQSTEDRWMLRNLSKREFVLNSKGSDINSLVQVLLALICWPTDLHLLMECDDYGPWAGDRIDVTLFSIHDEQECNNGDWKDITPRVVLKT